MITVGSLGIRSRPEHHGIWKISVQLLCLGVSWQQPQQGQQSWQGLHLELEYIIFWITLLLQTLSSLQTVVLYESPHINSWQFQQDADWNGSTVKEQIVPPFEKVQYTGGPLLISLFHNTPVREKQTVGFFCWLGFCLGLFVGLGFCWWWWCFCLFGFFLVGLGGVVLFFVGLGFFVFFEGGSCFIFWKKKNS